MLSLSAGLRTSGVIWLFWLALTLLSIPEFKSWIDYRNTAVSGERSGYTVAETNS